MNFNKPPSAKHTFYELQFVKNVLKISKRHLSKNEHAKFLYLAKIVPVKTTIDLLKPLPKLRCVQKTFL